MTDGGDGGFEVHPGDPWSPGWTDDASEDTATAASEQATPPEATKKRRRFGRKRHEREESVPVPDWPDADEVGIVVADDTRFRPTVESAPPPDGPPAPSRPGEEAPMPAWLSDPPRVERESPLPVELPSWVGASSVGAEGVAGAFEETPGESQVPALVEEDLAAALSALGVSGDDDVEVAPPDAFPSLTATEGEPSGGVAVTDDAFEALRRLEASGGAPVAGVYGVAGKEAFEALRQSEPGGDDLSDWQAFAGAETAAPVHSPQEARRPMPERRAGEETPAIADASGFDEWAAAAEEPRQKRGMWPFRRRRRGEEVVAEAPAEWEDDGTQVPPTWFPEVDEDAVVPPTADLPETEWPAEPAVPRAAAAVTPADPDRIPRPEAPPPVRDELEARRREAQRWEPPPPVIPVESREDQVRREVAAEDAEDLQAGGPWRLDFDDGTAETPYGTTEYDPVPPAAIRGDRDIWEPVDPDATVEMTDPGLRFNEDIYGGSVTIEHRGLAEEIFRLGEEDTEWQAMSAAMPGVESGVVGFEDVADLSTGEEYRERPRSDFGMRVGTGLLLIVFLLGTMFVGGGAMAIFIGAMALLGIWEFYGTLRRLEFQPLGLIGYLGGAGLLAAGWFHGPIAIPIGLAALVVLTFFVYAFAPLREDALANGGLTVLGAAWVAGTIVFAFPILHQEEFRVLVMAIVAATVAMDVGAYSFGRTWGRRALSPVVSPNKSIEGLIGGVLMAMGAAIAFGYLAEPFDIASGIALGAVVAVMAPLGDLAESMVKRSLGVKDMGTILPGHGGVLDRIDGFLFVLPAAWVLYQVIGFLG